MAEMKKGPAKRRPFLHHFNLSAPSLEKRGSSGYRWIPPDPKQVFHCCIDKYPQHAVHANANRTTERAP